VKNIGELFLSAVKERGSHPAVIYKNRKITYRQLFRKVVILAEFLRSAGLRRNDVVGIYGIHSPLQAVAIFAAALNDAAFQILHVANLPEGIKHQISDSGAKFLVGEKRWMDKIASTVRDRSIHAAEMNEWGCLVSPSLPKRRQPIKRHEPRNIPADVANIIYTSGSTGLAKGVVIPHRTLLDGARIVSGYLNIAPQDVILSVLPFSFDYGLNQLMSVVYRGATIVLHNFVTPNDLIDVARRANVTGLAAVPSFWPNFFNPKLVDPGAGKTIRTLRCITTAGGPHGKKLLTALTKFFPQSKVIIMYGLTESFRSTYLPAELVLKKIGSIGKAVPEVEILILNEKGEKCREGERGELLHRGAFITHGYLNNPELNKEKFVELETGGPGTLKERVVRSGDLVSRDREGFIYFHGRIDSQIKSYGFRISPTEVEQAALSFRGISHAAAFGVSDPIAGQRVCLAYSRFDGQEKKTLELWNHLKKKLPNYSVPGKVLFFKKMPTTSSGKINYPLLKTKADGKD
jgi:acyl-CoA synthetase (AMP-forming)/AMP-acid ligase II